MSTREELAEKATSHLPQRYDGRYHPRVVGNEWFKTGFDAGAAESDKRAEGLVKALKFYANENNWEESINDAMRNQLRLPGWKITGWNSRDHENSDTDENDIAGKRARKALKEWSDG